MKGVRVRKVYKTTKLGKSKDFSTTVVANRLISSYQFALEHFPNL